MTLKKPSPLLFALYMMALLIAVPLNASAQETQPGDACTAGQANLVRQVGGPENPGAGYLLVCDGSTWKTVTQWETGTGNSLFKVGYDAGACDATKEGRLRYNSSGDSWEYCHSNAWAALGGGTPAGSDRQVQFNSGGSLGADANFVYTSAGRVGIGTANPSALLELSSPYTPGLQGLIIDYYHDHNVPIATIKSQNDTGAWIEISGGQSAGLWPSGIKIQGKDATDTETAYIFMGQGTRGGSPNFTDYGLNIAAHKSGTANYSPIMFWTSNVERIRLTSAGNVGIGTASPAVPLDVAGEIKFSSSGLACSGTTEGAQRYDTATQAIQYCNGSSWTAIGGGSSLWSDSGSGYIQYNSALGGIRVGDVSGQPAPNIIGVTNLTDLGDVNAAGPTDQQVLTYDNASGKWIAAAAGGVPAGGDRQVQFNSGGSFGASGNVWVDSADALNAYQWTTGTSAGEYSAFYSLNEIYPGSAQGSRHDFAIRGFSKVRDENTSTVNGVKGVGGLAQSGTGSGTINSLVAVDGYLRADAGPTIIDATGTGAYLDVYGGTISSLEGVYAYSAVTGGTITDLYGLRVHHYLSGGTVTNRYGIKIDAPTGTATNDWGIYQDGTQDNYFAGNVGIENSSPSGLLEVGPGILYASSSGLVGIGTNTPSSWAQVTVNNWDLTPQGWKAGLYAWGGTTGSSSSYNGVVGLTATGETSATGSGTTEAYGVVGLGYGANDSKSQKLYGVSGTIKSFDTDVGYALHADDDDASTGGTIYGLYIDLDDTDATRYGIWQQSANDNYFAGNLRLGSSNYLNFGATTGLSGYGIRDNAGTIEIKNSGGSWAVAGGASAINDLSDGISAGDSVFLGFDSGVNDDGTANRNVGLGIWSMNLATTANNNVAIGYSALRNNVTGAYNVAIGGSALLNYTGGSSTAVGQSAMTNATTGSQNTAVGQGALNGDAGGMTGSNNVAVGRVALQMNSSGGSNTGIGHTALNGNTTGATNTGLGYSAMSNNTTGNSNVAVGATTFVMNQTGDRNTFVGAESGGSVVATKGDLDNNTVMGWRAGYNMTGGASGAGANNNIFLGYAAGDLTTTGDQNIIIGYNADASSATASNELNIGDTIFGTGLGTTSATVSFLPAATGGVRVQNVTNPAKWNGGTTTDANIVSLDSPSDAYQLWFQGNMLSIGENNGRAYSTDNRRALINAWMSTNISVGPTVPEVMRLQSNSRNGYFRVWQQSADTLGMELNNNGTTELYVDPSNHRVGIGTSSPSNKLTVDGGVVKFSSGALIGINNLNIGSGPYQAGYSATTGNASVYIGAVAGATLTTGSDNVAIGNQAMRYMETSSGTNVAIGSQALIGTAGAVSSGNVAIGYRAGNAITTGGSNIMIGVAANPPSGTDSNKLNIGNAITGDLSTGDVTIANDLTVTGNCNGCGGITNGTAVATTSGTYKDFTGIPAGVNRITVMLNQVSLGSFARLTIQLGDSGGIETTGYSSSASDAANNNASTTACVLVAAGNSSYKFSGIATFNRVDGNTWAMSSTLGGEYLGSGAATFSGCSKTLSATLDRVRLTNDGGGTFDNGSVNISYE